MKANLRKHQSEALPDTIFDVVVVGGGINGACLFHHLCKAGYKTLLVDKGDFSGGTSQASAMMIWGGLLYLANLDLAQVLQLSFSRDRMIRELDDRVQVCNFRYLSSKDGGRNTAFMLAALYLYWILGRWSRSQPRLEKLYSELELLKREQFRDSLIYQEASLKVSDARFVLQWILPNQDIEQIALNYCSLEDGAFDRSDQYWNVDLKDFIGEREISVKTRLVINTAGVWTDQVNQVFQMSSPYRHVFGKGVFIGLKRQVEHELPLIVDGGPYSECLSLIPWGPVALWGPTETEIASLEKAFRTEPEDVRFLLDQFNRHFKSKAKPEDIVSIRCGVRPLVVKQSFASKGQTLKISRHHRIYADWNRPWISVYGGKITNCVPLAKELVRCVSTKLKPGGKSTQLNALPEAVMENFPGLDEKVPATKWCKENEMCWNLEDYLRRRTNISQWIHRGGLGAENENLPHLASLASTFVNHDPVGTKSAVESYQRKIAEEFDAVLSNL